MATATRTWSNNGETVGQLPAGYTSDTGNANYIAVQAAPIDSGATNALVVVGDNATAHTLYSNATDGNGGDIVWTQTFQPGNAPTVVFHFRRQGSNDYQLTFTVGSGSMTTALSRTVSGTSTSLATVAGFAVPTAAPYKTFIATITANGAAISVQLQRTDTSQYLTPSGTFQAAAINCISVTDSAPILGAGTYGYQWYNGTTSSLTFGDSTVGPVPVAATLGTTTLQVGGTTQIVATGFDGTPTYASTNTAVATVSSSGLVTAVAVGSCNFTATGVNNTAQSATTASLAVIAVGVTIAANDPRYAYYGRWNVGSTEAITINAGSTIEFSYTGDHCTLNFDMTGIMGYPVIVTKVDDGPAVRTQLSASVSTISLTPTYTKSTIPRASAHTAVMTCAGIESDWTTQYGAVKFTGATIGTGESMLLQPACPDIIEFLGDSITASIRLLYNGTTDNGIGDMDASNSWPAKVGRMLGLKARIVGFGGTGILTTGDASVPPTPSTFPYIYQGVTWSPTIKPAVVVCYIGTNEASTSQSTYQPAYTSFLTQVRTAYPNAVIFAITPLAAPGLDVSIAAAVSGLGDPRIKHLNYSTSGVAPYVASTAGNTQDTSDLLHPNPGGASKLAAQLASDIQSTLSTLGIAVQGPAAVAASTYLLIPPPAPVVGQEDILGILFNHPLTTQTTVTLADANAAFPGGATATIAAGSSYGSVNWTPTTSGAHTFGVSHTGQSGISDPTTGLTSTVAAATTPATNATGYTVRLGATTGTVGSTYQVIVDLSGGSLLGSNLVVTIAGLTSSPFTVTVPVGATSGVGTFTPNAAGTLTPAATYTGGNTGMVAAYSPGTFTASAAPIIPAAGNVLTGAGQYGFPGSLITPTYVAPTTAQVISTATFGPGGGTNGAYQVVAANQVQSNVTFGVGQVGTFVGSGGGIQLSDLTNALAPISTGVTGLTTSVATLTTNLATVNTAANTINATVNTVNTAVGTINTTVGTINTTVGTINTAVAGLNTSVNAVNTAVNNIANGGDEFYTPGTITGVNGASLTIQFANGAPPPAALVATPPKVVTINSQNGRPEAAISGTPVVVDENHLYVTVTPAFTVAITPGTDTVLIG